MAVQAIKSGWLYKTPPKFNTKFPHWNRRHFDLFENGDLAYSKSSSANDAVLDLIRLCEVEQIVDAEDLINCLYTIALYNPITKRTFCLRGESEADIDAWCKAIQKHVPAYKELDIDARPVYKILPDHILESLPHRQGRLLTQHLEYFSKEKNCEIKDGKFRVYSHQYRGSLDLSYSLLPCKGVQDLTDGCKGKNNNFQFRIEFLNQQIQPLVLGAKTPFDRQGWIVCLMKTITILSKYQGSQDKSSIEVIGRPRSMSVPPDLPLFADLPREHLEEQMTQLLGELDIRDNWLSELKDDKDQLSTKVSTLKYENEHLRRCMTAGSKTMPRTLHTGDGTTDSTPSPLIDSHTRMKYTRPNNIKNFTSSPMPVNGNDSCSSSGSEGSNFRDCSSVQPKSSTGSNISITESLYTQLVDLCRELGCLGRDENADHVANLKQFIDQQNYNSNVLIQAKGEDILSLENQIQDQLAERTQAFENLKLQHELELNQSMEALRDKHRMELDGCRRELQSLETQHKCRVEAVEEENRKICEDITQLKVRESQITEEMEVKRVEFEKIYQHLSEEINDLKKSLEEKETQLKTCLPNPKPPLPPPKPPLPD